GLYATDVEWTDKAAAMIVAKEYRYLSPVFTYDKQGRVTGLLHVALTNNPALDELPELQVAVLSRLISNPSTTQEDSEMDELIEQLRWLLNLPVGATADDIQTQLQKLIDQLSNGQGTAAASVDLVSLFGTQQQRIAALSANQVDPARFVSVETMRALQEQVAALTAQQHGRAV
ncbi:phage protease, partial [Chromobacterium violaceum]